MFDRARSNKYNDVASWVPNQPDFIDLLKKLHPSGCIGEPESLAEVAVFLSTMPSKFINGCILNFDGGVRGMLSDL